MIKLTMAPFLILIGYYCIVATGAGILALGLVPVAAGRAYGRHFVVPAVWSVIRWYLLFWMGLAVELAGIVLNPFVTLFANHKTGRLPVGFRWMETYDALLPGFPPEQGFKTPYPSNWLAWYFQSVRWLYRNRVYRFTTEVMGMDTGAWAAAWKHFGSLSVELTPGEKRRGVVGLHLDSAGRVAWELCFANVMPKGKTLDFRAGYKLRNAWGSPRRAQHCIRLRPFTG